MSENSTLVTAQHFQYLAQRTVPEDTFLRELKQAASAAGIPAIWIEPAQASFLQILFFFKNARRGLFLITFG